MPAVRKQKAEQDTDPDEFGLGALMFVVALVMVELGRSAPENGGLVSWPSGAQRREI